MHLCKEIRKRNCNKQEILFVENISCHIISVIHARCKLMIRVDFYGELSYQSSYHIFIYLFNCQVSYVLLLMIIYYINYNFLFNEVFSKHYINFGFRYDFFYRHVKLEPWLSNCLRSPSTVNLQPVNIKQVSLIPVVAICNQLQLSVFISTVDGSPLLQYKKGRPYIFKSAECVWRTKL